MAWMWAWLWVWVGVGSVGVRCCPSALPALLTPALLLPHGLAAVGPMGCPMA